MIYRCSYTQTVKALTEWAGGNSDYTPYGEIIGSVDFDFDTLSPEDCKHALELLQKEHK